MKETRIRKWMQFISVFLAFLIMGASFKVMVLVKGFTEVRPVNAIPVPAGLCFGAVGGLACACGNLIADMFGTLGLSSSLGFIGNFLAAYMPYKLWYAYRDEAPNVHSKRKLAIYCWVTFVAAIAIAWIIGGGLWMLFDVYEPHLSEYIFLNDMVFPILFGLPVFIVATSDSVNIRCCPKPKDLIPLSQKCRKILILIYTVLVTVLVIMAHFGRPEYKLCAMILSIPAIILTVILML